MTSRQKARRILEALILNTDWDECDVDFVAAIIDEHGPGECLMCRRPKPARRSKQ